MSYKCKFIIGKCIRMCPMIEIKIREHQGNLNFLEVKQGTKKAEVNRCIKCYKGSGAGEKQNFDLVRPPHICLKTVNWMFNILIDEKIYNFSNVYTFFDDRLRALFKDLRVQHCYNHHFSFLIDVSIRFRILGHFILKDSKYDSNLYWPRLNKEQLVYQFKQLSHYNNDNKKKSNLKNKILF